MTISVTRAMNAGAARAASITFCLLLALAVAAPAPAADDVPVVRIANVSSLHAALREINQTRRAATLELADGVYRLGDTLGVNVAGVTLRSASRDPQRVIIEGDRMAADARIGNLIWVGASDFTLSGITLRRAGQHLIQVAGELDVDRVVVENCVLQDAWQQLFKVSRLESRPDVYADDGRIEGCEFGYTAGIGPQYYIGGIDAHGARNWVVRNNVFRDIASPSREIAQYAVHFWSDSSGTLVEHNTIIDCDRGIGFGLRGRPHTGGIVRNNLILHADNGDRFADVGIGLVDATGATVQDNRIYQLHAYRWSIEYNFLGTRNATITGNLANRPIQPDPGGGGHVIRDNRIVAKDDVPRQWLPR